MLRKEHDRPSGSHQVQDGKVRIHVCEVNVVHYCNLSCTACSHLSPKAPKYFVRPDQVYRDLSLLSHHCRPDRVSLLGGEPLLHSNLLDVVDAVRQSGATDCLRVVTNGLLLRKMPESFWQRVDQVHISLHPEQGIGADSLVSYRRQARRHGVDLVVRYAEHFRVPYAEEGTSDERLIRRVFSSCEIAHTWQCHAICEGYFYRCSQSIMIPRVLLGRKEEECTIDGLSLSDSDSFGRELLSFLTSDSPLSSCQYCLGTAGLPLSGRQESGPHPKARRTAEELLDLRHLEFLEHSGARRESASLQAAAGLAQRILSVMPASLRVHPLVPRLISRIRRIHPSLR